MDYKREGCAGRHIEMDTSGRHMEMERNHDDAKAFLYPAPNRLMTIRMNNVHGRWVYTFVLVHGSGAPEHGSAVHQLHSSRVKLLSMAYSRQYREQCCGQEPRQIHEARTCKCEFVSAAV